MANLSQVYSNLGVGVFISSTCYLLFGIAVRTEKNSNLTPRAWARPIAVIKNCLSPPYSVNWVSWAMSLRYIDLLAGIPGTGTRRNGWSGPNLKTNLDGIVLLRYHTLQFKVSAFATVLCMMLLLPLYYTAQCDPLRNGKAFCDQHRQNTDFEQLTIANVVPHGSSELVYKNGTTVKYANPYYYNETTLNDLDIVSTMNFEWTNGVSERYVALTVVIALITIYSCYLLRHEWIECLALRRVYFLESEYYEERLDELDEIRTNSDPEDPFQTIRPPFLPHPEMRETVPNVSLHSVLYKLPSNLKSNFENTSEKSLLERQLEAAVEFFDQCIPNQPGYSSSIVAITMIPDAKKMTKIWGKWYICGNKMRRLRYIKYQLERRKAMKEAGELGVHDVLVAAPVRAAKVTAKATAETLETVKEKTTEGIGTMKVFTAEKLETMKHLTAEGVEVIRGLTHRNDGSAEEAQEGRGRGRMKRGTATSVFVSCREDEFFDAEAYDLNDNNDGGEGVKRKSDVEPSKDIDAGSSSLSLLRGNETPAHGDNEGGESDRNSDGLFVGSSAATSGLEVVAGKGDLPDGEEDHELSFMSENSAVPGFREGTSTDHFEYEEFDPITFAKWIGYAEETALDQIVDTLDIEQLSVFARETSQSASNPCVYGFSPHTIHLLSVEQLEVMLEDAWDAAREANAELLLARREMFEEEKIRGSNARQREVDFSDDTKTIDRMEELTTNEDGLKRKSVAISSAVSNSKKDTTLCVDPVMHSDSDNNILNEKPDGLRKRGRRKQRAESTRARYDKAQKLVKELNAASTPISESGEETGGCCHDSVMRVLGRGAKNKGKSSATHLDHPSYCVATFSSRQAAIAARQCLADGKGIKAWAQVQNIPMNPLADAPPRNIFFCRGCCRPVALTISNREKRTRKILVWCFYVLFYFVYMVPLTLTSQLLNPTVLADYFPDVDAFQNPDNFFFKILAGISAGWIYTLFLSILPQIFKVLAFSEGSSSSKVIAEENAMRFYWYFILVTSFFSQYLVQMFLNGIVQGNVGAEFKDILSTVAASIATSLAPTWLSWIIVRTGTTLPMNYLLQSMTFLYGWLGIPWLNRVMRGGGPGGPPPYRIYIDSGLVFMCLTSLAPACPIIAPACLFYYTIFIPILRWLHIFVYRPFYDGGGNRLPVIHEIIISSLILSHLLLGTVLLLKQSFILGIIVVTMAFPTFIFSLWTKEEFQRSYEDAGLWQTSKLDGLSNKESMQDREKYRRWLVDAHKASYVPICLSGGEDFLTNQPAVVVPLERQEVARQGGSGTKTSPRESELQRQYRNQKGAIYRRYIES